MVSYISVINTVNTPRAAVDDDDVLDVEGQNRAWAHPSGATW